jgi:hypothetical protein
MIKRSFLLIIPMGLALALLSSLPSCSTNPAAPAPVTVTQAPVTLLVTATNTPTGSPTLTFTVTNTPTSTDTPVTILVTSTATMTPSFYPTPATGVSWSTGGSLGVAVSGSLVWVGDYSVSMEVYTLGGTPVTTFGLGYYASGIVPDGSGGVYASGSCNNLIQHITSAFAKGVSFSTTYCSNGLAVDNAGNFYTTDAFGGSNLIQKYSNAGAPIDSWPVTAGNPFGIAIAGNPQTIYVASQTTQEIYTFDLNGNPLPTHWSIGSDGSALAIDPSGRLYVGGYNTATAIQRFGLTGSFQMQWGSFTSEGIAFDGSGNIYVANGALLQVFIP